jgi:hypothetical protein
MNLLATDEARVWVLFGCCNESAQPLGFDLGVLVEKRDAAAASRAEREVPAHRCAQVDLRLDDVCSSRPLEHEFAHVLVGGVEHEDRLASEASQVCARDRGKARV